mgnify:CR=1 FL=1
MNPMRIRQHPILTIPEKGEIPFTWNGASLSAFDGEMISSALIANGVHIFGHHAKDGSPQGLFCANGQCSQCLVIADGRPVKACMTPLRAGMAVQSVEGLPRLPAEDAPPQAAPVEAVAPDVLIIGGGPAGLSAAIELGKLGVRTLVIDDKDRLGGKLVLQTHKFFGSVEDSYAGTRGFEIGRLTTLYLGFTGGTLILLAAGSVGSRVLLSFEIPVELLLECGELCFEGGFPLGTQPGELPRRAGGERFRLLRVLPFDFPGLRFRLLNFLQDVHEASFLSAGRRSRAVRITRRP